MIKKQIIGFVLILLAILSLSIFLLEKSDFDFKGYTFTIEMFYGIFGICIFCVFWAVGAFIKQKMELVYWSIFWGITSIIAGTLSLWEFILSINPTAESWAGLAQQCIYYLTGIPLSQIAVLLATLGWQISRDVKNKILSWFTLFCLTLTSIGILPFIIIPILLLFHEGGDRAGFLGILVNTLPLLITIPLLLSILKKTEKKLSS
jgi:hypothetical protein